MSKFKGVVKFLSGFATNKGGKQIETQVDAWKAEADCGCGIDCCNNCLVLRDKATGNKVNISVSNGVIVINNGT